MSFSLFPSFFDRPIYTRLAHQEKDEHIELFLRRHWVTNLPWILFVVLALVLPVFFPLLNQFLESIILLELPGDLISSVLIIWYLLILAYTIEQFLHWYFNIYIVTNRHLVDINFVSLMYRDITEASLADVESARSRIQGVAGALFNFGNVTTETAAKAQAIEFLSIPKPDFVADRIQDLQQLRKGEVNSAD